jgi:acetoin utilization protein AcuB
MSKVIPPVSKYMTTTPVSIDVDATLAEAATLMKKHSIRHLPVVSEGKLLGILTDRDVKFVETFWDVDPDLVTVYRTMTDDPYQVAPATPLDEVASAMAKERLGSAVIVEDGRVVGVFTTVDACRCLAELLEPR